MQPTDMSYINIDEENENNLAEKNPEIIEKMNVIVKREHIHPHILDWEFIDPKITRN